MVTFGNNYHAAIGVDEKAMEISREKTRGGKIHRLYWDSDSNDGSPLDTSHANEVAEEVPVIYQLTVSISLF